MAGHKHRAALAAQRPQQITDLFDAGRVQAVGRLVQDQHLGILEQGSGQAQALAHPQRIALDQVIGPLGQPDPLQGRAHPARPDALQAPQQLQVAPPAHGREQGRSLYDRPNPTDDPVQFPANVGAEQPAGPGGGGNQPQQAADGGGLTGPVRAQEPEHAALRDGEVQPIDRHARASAQAPVLLTQPSDFDHVHR
jgi:hypothetical protein